MGVLPGAGQAASELLEPGGTVKASGRQHELGPAVVQQPPQPVLDPGALPDQVLAMVEQELDLPLGAVKPQRSAVSRRPPQALRWRRPARRSGRSCRPGAGPAVGQPSGAAAPGPRSPRASRNRSSLPE